MPGEKKIRLANCDQTSRKSAPAPLLSVFSYSARRSASVQSRRAKPTIAHSDGRLPPLRKLKQGGHQLAVG